MYELLSFSISLAYGMRIYVVSYSMILRPAEFMVVLVWYGMSLLDGTVLQLSWSPLARAF